MIFLRRFYSSSIGRKFFVAVAGICLCGFLVLHLLGNLLIFKGAPVFNRYASALDSNPLIPAAELILAGFFLLHILIALWLRYENKRARPMGYARYEDKGGRTWGSRTITWTALMVLAFLIVHLKSIRFGDKSRGVYHLVMASLQNPFVAIFYVISMGALALHLSHGVQSAFQTLGLNHPKYTPLVKTLGRLFAAVICIGFAAIPIWALFLKP